MVRYSLETLRTAGRRGRSSATRRRWRLQRMVWPLKQPLQLARARRHPDRVWSGIPRHVSQFEVAPDVPAEPVVLFHTRAWAEKVEGVADHHTGPNFQRAELIRTLQRRLGARFRGGFAPSPYAREHFADCLSDQPIRAGRLHAGGAAVRHRRCRPIGLQRSTPYKIPENLSASRAIVSDPLHFGLPTPARGRHPPAHLRRSRAAAPTPASACSTTRTSSPTSASRRGTTTSDRFGPTSCSATASTTSSISSACRPDAARATTFDRRRLPTTGPEPRWRRQVILLLLGVMVRLPLRFRMALYYRSQPRRMLRWIGDDVVGIYPAGPPDHRSLMTLSVNESWPYLLGVYEHAVMDYLRRVVRPGSTVIDVGGHTGYHAIYLARLVGPRRPGRGRRAGGRAGRRAGDRTSV